MIQILRRFLWGGSDEVRKMAWIRWSRICLPKERGGLGIRNMQLFYFALLGKWKWRIIADNPSVWPDLLKILYGENGLLHNRQASTWWKDLKGLDECVTGSTGWF